jgi:hypothetical protein
MSRYNAAISLPADEHPAALQRDRAVQPKRDPKPDAMLGIELLIDDIDEHMSSANQAGAALRRAHAAHDLLGINAAALEMRKHLRSADALAQAAQDWISRQRRREPRVRG